MSRTYDSAGRKQGAEFTRRRILAAAVELHGRGIMTYEPLAAAAGVSLPTVRKHFPNKEVLFKGCTNHFFETFTPPALEDLARIADAGERTQGVASEMCRVHEETHDLLWYSHAEAKSSATLAAVLADFDAIVKSAADTIVDGTGLKLDRKEREAARARLSSLLHPLTYRAFRVHTGLDVETTASEITALVAAAIAPTS
jgi:AcrR family transcriptional regulator